MPGPRWLLLIHNVPPKPAYFRVKIWRRLQRLGAVALKNSVYVLPNSEAAAESFEWVMKEINEGKGEATICAAQFVNGISDSEVERLFVRAREADYASLLDQARELAKNTKKKLGPERQEASRRELQKLQKQLSEISSLDFFQAPGKEAIAGLLGNIEARLQAGSATHAQVGGKVTPKAELQNRTWVTRKGIHVDRMASAWLIRRFIDPSARFKFVDAKGYRPAKGDLRFDMYEGEFTHEGDLCTFEVLVKRMNLQEAALKQLAEIVHDLDLKDGKYGHEETAGFEQMLKGIVARFSSDEDRLAKASDVLDNLYEVFRPKKK